MTTSVSRPEDVVNIALAKIGYSQLCVDMYDGSPVSRAALSVYAHTRDSVTYAGEWDFVERTVQGILLKQAPTIPPNYIVTPWNPSFPALPWAYEYLYPPDAVKIRSVKNLPAFIPNFDPRYNRFSIDNDIGFSPAKRVILTNVPNAVIVYAGQITDPTQWDDGFTDLMADELAKAMGPILMGVDAVKIATAEEPQDAMMAELQKQRG